MKVQGRFMQTNFIEIHQVFAKKRSDTFLTMKFRRGLWTLPHSNAACHQLTLLTGGKKDHVSVWRFKVASCKRASLKSTRVSQNNKVGYFSNRVADGHDCYSWRGWIVKCDCCDDTGEDGQVAVTDILDTVHWGAYPWTVFKNLTIVDMKVYLGQPVFTPSETRCWWNCPVRWGFEPCFSLICSVKFNH